MQPWFERFPGRLEYELDELEREGFLFSLDDERKTKGRIHLTVVYPIGKDNHTLEVWYPDLYPWVPFSIFGFTLPSGRHICPTSGLLCLMQKPQTNWDANFTIKWALQNPVKTIVESHLDPANDKGAREGQQHSGYYIYSPNSIMLTSEWEIDAKYMYGQLIIGVEPGSNPNNAFRGAVLEVQDNTGKRIAVLPEKLAKRYPQTIRGRWVRLTAPPNGRQDGPGELSEAVRKHESLRKIKPDKGFDIVGLLYPEESGFKTPVENWLFTLRTKQASTVEEASRPQLLIRTDTIGKENLLARVPTLSSLDSKKVLLVGLGAIGSVIAGQLARAGIGHLALLDDDFVQVGNMPRWIAGLPAIGKLKVQAMAEYLLLNYPFTAVSGVTQHLGSPGITDGQGGDFALMEELLKDADLVIDATAEERLSMALSVICREKGIPYLWATGTHGSRGGVVGRVIPHKTQGCWQCFQHHMTNGTIITPQKEDRPEVQPKGCFHPTFTGTGFDMDNIALAATRLAVSTLCRSEADAYPDLAWDVGVLNLWDSDQNPIFPTWVSYVLTRHTGCPDHA